MNTLTLSISNLDQLHHDVQARHHFDRKGGTIGSANASWRLDDRQRSIAPIHCEIRWIEGSFCVIDRCQRTYLNDSTVSLRRQVARRLMEGDQLHIGTYRLRVHYTRFPADAPSLEALFAPDNRVLERLVADQPANSRQHLPAPVIAPIGSFFDPALGNDPLAALDALAPASVSPTAPVHRLLIGGRP
jgi:type VI secretion system protein ImpI